MVTFKLDSRFRGNDCDFEDLHLAIYTIAQLAVPWLVFKPFFKFDTLPRVD